jgi:hypothetical protein
MNANEKYLNWLEGYLRKTIDSTLEKAFKAHITRKQKAMKIFYDLFDPIYFRDKDSSHEHHDLIVGKGDLEII